MSTPRSPSVHGPITRRSVCALLGAAAAGYPFASSHAQEFLPSGTVNLISGFAAGGGADTAARIVATRLSESIGRPVVVQNRAGAGGTIAHQAAAAAAPDGLTILLDSIGPLAILPHLLKQPPEGERELAPITMGMNFPNVLVVHPQLGAKNLAAFIALAKSKPGQITFGSSGIGASSHLCGELFNYRTGVEMTHVAYKGGSQVLIDLLAGRVSCCFFTPATAQQYVETGKLIALATTGLERPAAYPNVPTIAESGYPGFNATNWYAFMAPGKTPEALLERWNRELAKVLMSTEVHDQLMANGLVPAPGTRQDLRRFISAESQTWAKVIKERKITAA